MGRDKALLPLDGVPLAARTALVLRAGGCEPVMVVGRRPELRALGLPVLFEPGFGGETPEERGHHPLLGLATALASLTEGLALVAPCDLVGLRAEHVALLLAVGCPCVARAGGRVHPLLAVLSVHDAARAAALAAEDGSAFALTGGLFPVDLPERALHDANRPEDLLLG